MRRVFLETPYAGDVATNLAYARACAAECIRRGEAPFASHLLYTQEGILDDDVPEERARGIEAGQAFLEVCEASVVYVDRGVSRGMQLGIDAAELLGIPVELRRLDPAWESRVVFSGPGRWVPVEEKLPGPGWRVEVVHQGGGTYYPARFLDGAFFLDTPTGRGEMLPDGWVAFWRGNLAVQPDDLGRRGCHHATA